LALVTAIVDAHARNVWARLERQPGIRTLASPAFQAIVGLVLLGAALLFLAVLLLAVDRAGGFEIDFVAAYRRASLDLLAGRSPYLPEQLDHAFPATGRYGWYLYPPAFAQILTPLAVLPARVGAIVWLALQAAMLFTAGWVAASAAGAARSLNRVIWIGVAVTFFLPVHEVLWTGNMGGPLALTVAALLVARPPQDHGESRRGLIAGVLAGAIAVFKLAPVVWLPAISRAGRGLALGSVLGIAAVLVPSVLLVPQAWLDYARVLPNLLNGDARYAHNLAPAVVALNLGLPGLIVDGVRLGAIVLSVALVIASLRLSMSRRGWPAAVASVVVAGLLLPAALWYHYLVLLLPLAIFAWVRADVSARLLLLAGWILVGAGISTPVLAASGTFALCATLVAELWPKDQRTVRRVA
jgi:hypothetical protein